MMTKTETRTVLLRCQRGDDVRQEIEHALQHAYSLAPAVKLVAATKQLCNIRALRIWLCRTATLLLWKIVVAVVREEVQ
jgi:hypothetical protein